MKKGVYLFSVLIISLMLVLQLVIAADVNVSDADDVASKIDKAYGCLEDKVVDNCDSLSLEEKIFSLLALGECKEELIDEAEGDKECWPSGSCDLKLTALATLALDSVGTSTANAEEWLLSQNTIPSNIDWFLEIENSEDDTSCTVTYSDDSYDIDIGNNKKLSSGAGSCLSLESHEYWLKVAPNCYDLEFDTSCDKGFLTTLLFKKDDSSTIHVSENAHKASAEGITTETVNSLCFAEGSDCDYEGSLWATLVLDYLDNDVSAYIPYLVTMADENEKYLPEAFLYLLTGYADFKNDLLLKQKSSKYWDEAGDKFYDTALALYPFQSIEPLEKQNSKDWLLEVQGDSGCWDSENTRNTAFILYSLWPRRTGGGDNTGPEDFDCEEAGFFCVSKINCDGIIKSNYECSGTFKCCTEPESLDTCDEQGGDICNSVEECVGGMVQSASDLDIGQECCIGGSCQTPADETECESYGGTCRSFDCNNAEKESSDDCNGGGICCVEDTTPPPKGGYWWVWLLLILIILLIVAIIFRDKLRPYWFKIKSKFKRGKPGPRVPPSAFPSTPSRMHPGRPMPRRILPPARRAPGRPPARRPKGDIDDVLKKLKAMGK